MPPFAEGTKASSVRSSPLLEKVRLYGGFFVCYSKGCHPKRKRQNDYSLTLIHF